MEGLVRLSGDSDSVTGSVTGSVDKMKSCKIPAPEESEVAGTEDGGVGRKYKGSRCRYMYLRIWRRLVSLNR